MAVYLAWGQVGGDCLGNVFILLLLMGVNRLGQPREEIAELALDHEVYFRQTPVGGRSLSKAWRWGSLCILGWQLRLGW